MSQTAYSQLLSLNEQDEDITEGGTLSFFIAKYKKYGNFANLSVFNSFNNDARFGNQAHVEIQREANLMNRMHLKLEMEALTIAKLVGASAEDRSHFRAAFIREFGLFFIKSVAFTIGSNEMDKRTGDFMSTWHEYTRDINTDSGYREMIGDIDDMTTMKSPDGNGVVVPATTLYVPLDFWFCNRITESIRLNALARAQLRLKFHFNDFEKCVVRTNNLAKNDFNHTSLFISTGVLVNYVYLTEDQAKALTSTDQSLYTKLQYNDDTADVSKLNTNIDFNFLIKAIMWKVAVGAYISGDSPFLCYSDREATNNSSGWVDALHYAATNLLVGSVKIAEDDDLESDEFLLTGTGADVWNSASVVKSNVSDSSKYVAYSFVPGPGVNTGSMPAAYAQTIADNGSTTIDSAGFVFKKSVFTNPKKPSYNLGDHVTRWAIVIKYGEFDGSGVGVASSLTYEVQVVEHDVTVRDVSCPVSSWVDNRYTKNAVTKYGSTSSPTQLDGAPMDIIAILPRSSGLLINNKYNTCESAVIKFNGNTRTSDTFNGIMYSTVLPSTAFTHTSSDGQNCYPISENMTSYQPTGTANLSRLSKCSIAQTLASDVPNPDSTRFPPSLNVASATSVITVTAPTLNTIVYDNLNAKIKFA